MTTTCTAYRHGTPYYRRRYGCTCPAAIEAARTRNRDAQARRYIPSRLGPGCPRGGRTDPIDPIAVERAVSGDPPAGLLLRELHAAIDRLDARGWSAARIATQLGTTVRTVQRQRARRRAAQSTQEVSAA